ncbi:branched-chain amino acid aminotransferase [Meinhardsimonia xiamenensis]|jgi:branched-chain amino acid aminotransferase|uniref:Probable branched-chain-amino-acid aminotransferase n=1 Tax=Meinhardsimonia xiamenensis TaxID=990712 RepID=A0A1G9BI87_9RHOB|nr:aminotransferase class IV [Meinhardsimonia xiamenensis]PRX34971.1 branched-chain amino acid aminotransferase [Meinhardsimonia xiamenensis]SDK39157.1 branched-chain amino acid aminotransferase [Meinhardsimonia xiamenensis]
MTDTHRPTTHDAEHDPRNDHILIHVNGRLVPKDKAVVSVYDSGFMLGDGMWEGMRLHDGVWVFFDEHMDRLFDACRAVSIDIGKTREELRAILDETAAANGMVTDAHARLMITRGRKAKPFQHPSLSRWGPTIVAIVEHSRPSAAVKARGVRLATVPQVRGLPNSQDPKLNSHSKLNCVIACLQAEAAGADEALMLDPHGFVNTTNACNFFIVRRGELWTSTGDYCMNGITRAKVIELARKNGIPVFQKNFSLYETYGAEEAFLTGSFGGITPVAAIDGKPIGKGEGAGPLTSRLARLYEELVAAHVAARKAVHGPGSR